MALLKDKERELRKNLLIKIDHKKRVVPFRVYHTDIAKIVLADIFNEDDFFPLAHNPLKKNQDNPLIFSSGLLKEINTYLEHGP